jgi:hypothetical protein
MITNWATSQNWKIKHHIKLLILIVVSWKPLVLNKFYKQFKFAIDFLKKIKELKPIVLWFWNIFKNETPIIYKFN